MIPDPLERAFYLAFSNVHTDDDYTLDRMRMLLNHLGNPQDAYPSVHVAGTSGKTSTCYFVRALLESAGLYTGLTVSPCITSLTERIQLGGAPVSEDEFLGYLNEFRQLVSTEAPQPTYFEALTAFAFWVFARARVDYAVIETGLGGLLDETNVITRPDKVCVITEIGFDHTEILGETLTEIARHKAGIIQPGAAVFIQEQDSEIIDVIRETADRQNATVTVIQPPHHFSDHVIPDFQGRNIKLAQAVYAHLSGRRDLPMEPMGMADLIADRPRGRWDIVEAAGKSIIFDGAHNPQEMSALRATISAHGMVGLPTLISVSRGPQRKLDAMLAELAQITDDLIVSSYVPPLGFENKAFSPSELRDQAQRCDFRSLVFHERLDSAFADLLGRPGQAALVTGSIYGVRQAMRLCPARFESN